MKSMFHICYIFLVHCCSHARISLSFAWTIFEEACGAGAKGDWQLQLGKVSVGGSTEDTAVELQYDDDKQAKNTLTLKSCV